jgi:GNAT superfamily N-acetyltransferase
MVATEAAIVELNAEDALAALDLSREAHWNQIEDDWLLFLTMGRVFGVRDDRGTLVATAALLPFDDGNAWISMVLVTTQSRRKGFATRLVQACIDAAAADGLVAWLDATADGAAVYRRMGFSPSIELHRMRFSSGRDPASHIDLPVGQVDALLARDRATMGFDRASILRVLTLRAGSRVLRRDDAIGLVRDGRAARHIGPLFAGDTSSALNLVKSVVTSDARPHLIDAAAINADFVKALIDAGWSLERSFLRMRFGQPVAAPETSPFAAAGPEYG